MSEARMNRPRSQRVGWKEPEVDPACSEFGVRSYLHQFYDGPEPTDPALYEDWESCPVSGRRRQAGCCGPSRLRQLLTASLLLLGAALICLLIVLLLPAVAALTDGDVTVMEVACLSTACLGAAGTLTAICLMLQMKSSSSSDDGGLTDLLCCQMKSSSSSDDGGLTDRLNASMDYETSVISQGTVDRKIPTTESLVSIQPECLPRYDVKR